MRNRSKSMIAIAITVGAVVAAGCNTYFIREGSGGNVLWNASEAYFFVNVSRLGLHVNCLRYPWVFVKEFLGAIESPDDERSFLVVIRVTSSGLEHHLLKLGDRRQGGGGSDPSKYTPLEGHIYANCPSLDGLCRWAGDHFEQATPEERQRLDSTSRLTESDIENGQNGWSKREFGSEATNRKYTIEVGDKFRLLVSNFAVKGTENCTVSVDLLRPGKSPERIGEFYARRGTVSRTEYRHEFQTLR